MRPVLIEIWGFPLHTYGLLLALGFVFGVRFAVGQAERSGLDPDRVTNVLLLVLACSIVGARAVFVAINWDHFSHNPWAIVELHRGGMVFYGGLIGGVIGGLGGALASGLPVARFVDACPAGLAIGQMLGRLGCLFNGCCYGLPTDLPWALRLRHGPGAVAARHPTQLYEIALLAAIFILSVRLLRRPHRPGMVLVQYLYLYGAGRFAVEMFRGDDRGGVFLAYFSISQVISLGLIGLAVAGHLIALRGPVEDHYVAAPGEEPHSANL